MSTSTNPFQYRDPITPETLDRLFAHHRSLTGGWSMTQGPGEPGGQQGSQGSQGTQDPPAGGQQGAQGTGDQGQQGSQGAQPPPPTQLPPSDPDYFPANTPVADMTDAQRAGYYKFQSQKHERRATEWYQTVGGGKKTAAEVAAELEQQRQASMTEQQRAVEAAREEGKREATGAMSQSMATLALTQAMAHVPESERAELLSMIDRSTVIKEDGTIDTDKVAKVVARVAPVNGRGSRDPDFGGGQRGTGTSGSTVAAGASRYHERHAKKSTTTS